MRIERVPMPEALRARYAKDLARVRGRGLRSWLTRRAWGEQYYAWMAAGLERDAADGVLESMEVAAGRLVVGDERADEGPLLFMDVGGGQVLCLCGQWLHDPHVVRGIADLPAEAWFRRFALVRAPGTGEVIGIDPLGTEVLPSSGRVPVEDVAYFGQSVIVPGRTTDVREALAPFHALAPRRRR